MNHPYKISEISAKQVREFDAKIDIFNVQQLAFTGTPLEEELHYAIAGESGGFIAGITGVFYLKEILYIRIIFVDEAYRHQGLGKALLNKIENEARARGARLVHLDTFDFQARDFYLKYGYEDFGVLENCPHGHKRYYMKKVF